MDLWLPFFAWVDRWVLSLKSATLHNMITGFSSFTLHWLLRIAAKYSFHPNHYHSTPMRTFFLRFCRYMLTIDFNFIIETYYNIQYHHASHISFSSLTLSHSRTLSTPVCWSHSSFNLIGESESIFFKKGYCTTCNGQR